MFESTHQGNDDDISSRVITSADARIAEKICAILCFYVNVVGSEKEGIVTPLICVYNTRRLSSNLCSFIEGSIVSYTNFQASYYLISNHNFHSYNVYIKSMISHFLSSLINGKSVCLPPKSNQNCVNKLRPGNTFSIRKTLHIIKSITLPDK